MPSGKKKEAVKKVEVKKELGKLGKEPEPGQIADIEAIEGIGSVYGNNLKKVGIKTTEDLRKASVEELAKATGIGTTLLSKWQCIADLFRVKRAAKEYSEFIYEMGIKSVKELSEQKAEDLLKKVQGFAKGLDKKAGWQGKVRKAPNQKDIEIWIASAKELIQ